jgi:hypothetical protein
MREHPHIHSAQAEAASLPDALNRRPRVALVTTGGTSGLLGADRWTLDVGHGLVH